MPEQKWSGKLGPLMKKHLDLRAAVGRVTKSDAFTLNSLNEFLLKNYSKANTLSRLIILDYLRTKSHLKVSGKKVRVVHIRQFCKFLNQRGIDCYVPDKTLLPKYKYIPRYYPLTENDILQYMKCAKNINTKKYIGETYSASIGLLWCTGMRSRELMNLLHQDVDLEQSLIVIRQTKFFKDRIIPINSTVSNVLKKHVKLKEQIGYSIKDKKPFFTNYSGNKLTVKSLAMTMKKIGVELNIKKIDNRKPSPHDLRHNFATQTMAAFFKDPEKYPPSVYMPRLSTYLGHTTLFTTQYYLHPDFNLIQKATQKFKVPK